MSEGASSRLVRALERLLKSAATPFINIFNLLFGHLSWSPPDWISEARQRTGPTFTWVAKHGVVFGVIFVLALGLWWTKPIYENNVRGIVPNRAESKPVGVEITMPSRTEIEKEKEHERLPHPIVLLFNESAAPLAQVGKEAPAVTLHPGHPGKWVWETERALKFIPQEDWPVGAEYEIRLGDKALSPHVDIKERVFKAYAPKFEITVPEAEFYQDPVQVNQRHAVFEVRFSHPIEPADFEKHVKLIYGDESRSVLDFNKANLKYNVIYDKHKLKATVQSEPLGIPTASATVMMRIAAGLSAQRGGNSLEKELVKALSIPGINGLAIEQIEASVVTGEDGEPQRVLHIKSSMPVHEREITRMVSVWKLPTRAAQSKGEEPQSWEDPTEVTAEVLKRAQRVSLTPIPQEREANELHAFRFQADAGAFLLVRIQTGLKAVGGYQLAAASDAIVKTKPFAPTLAIASKGSLLALNGEKKLPILVRDLPGVQIELGRLLPHQLHLLATQNTGAFTQPQFHQGVTPDHLSERFEKQITLTLAPGKTHYETVDFAEYLKLGTTERRGAFLLSVRGYDPKKPKTAESAWHSNPQYHEEYSGEGEEVAPEPKDPTLITDHRLVLVTDLGFIVKKALDGAQDVFVQSISSGAPVADADVEVWGKNGLVLVNQKTDASGRARLAHLSSYVREKQPVLIVVKKSGDLSFMPLVQSDRGLDFTRFDVGGARSTGLPNQMRAYLFSDRGIYRPGDTMRVGIIVKSGNWAQDLKDLPLEAEIIDARGLVAKREKLKVGATGLTEIAYTTFDNSPTGNYTIHLNLARDTGSAVQEGKESAPLRLGSTTVKVQEFMPDRMKIAARLSSEVAEGWVHPRDLKASITVQNLFGTPAPKRRVESTLTLTPAYPAFRSYSDYAFFDPQRAKDKHSELLSPTETNDQGIAELDLGLHRYQSATYQLHLLAKAFEPGGGRSVAAETMTMVSEQPYLVGYKTDGDLGYVNRGGVRNISLVAIDPSARKIVAKDLKLQFVERKVLSVLIKQTNGLYKYESKPKEILLKEQALAIPAAGNQLALATSTPGNYAYVIRNPEGLELNRIQYSVVGEGNVSRSLDRNAELQLALNKKDYAPGGEIEVSIRAPYTGSGLITIERDRVYTHQWFKTSKTASVQKIKLPKDFEGNGYITVQFVRDAASDEIYMSPLSYGVVPFATSLAKRTARVTLRTPSLVKPGQAIKIKIDSEKPAKAIVFAIDEGILQVARYQNPDPLKYFFEKRALEVESYQILDLILPEFTKLMQAKAPGGDAASTLGKHLNPFKRKGEKPVVFWSGVIDVKTGSELSYTVPESFNGSLRVMAVIVTDDTVAAKANNVVVRGDLILLPTVPVALTPGDEAEIGIGLANNIKGSGKEAPIMLTLKTSSGLEVIGPPEQRLDVTEKSEATTKFRVRARTGEHVVLGSASIIFSAQYKDKTARLENTLSVRPASPFVTLVQTGKFKGTGELTSQAALYPDFQHSEVAFSSSPWSFTAGLLQYLVAYPHGCTEQITSQTFPMVVLSTRPELAELLAVRRKLGAGEEAPDIKKSFARTINVLRSRQSTTGGFGLWGADDYVSFASVYATHMLLEARERKLAVPEDMYQKSLAQLQLYVLQSPSDRYNWRNQAYAAYVLTRQGIITTAALFNLRNAMPSGKNEYANTDLGLAYLAASYQMLKQDKAAQELLKPVWEDFVTRIEKNLRHDYRDYYYDPLVHDASVLYLIAKHFPAKLKQLPPQTFERIGALVQDGWYHSLSSAEVILAVDAYSTAVAQASSGKIEASAVSRSGKTQAVPFGSISPLAKAVLPLDTAKLRVNNKGELPLFYSLSEAGYERNIPQTAEFKGMQISREFLNSKGESVTVASLGEELTVRIRVRSTGRTEIPQVALADLLPGALEPVLTSPGDNADSSLPLWRQRLGGSSSWRIDYADIREDRVIFYGNVGYGDNEVTYKVRATNVGEFIVPPAWGEAMYDRRIFARSAGGKLTIKPLAK